MSELEPVVRLSRVAASALSALVLLAAALGLAAAPAGAAVTQTAIIAPADHSYLLYDNLADTSVTVNGTAPGALDTDTVDLNCYSRSAGTVTFSTLKAGVPISGGAFTYTGSLYPIRDSACVLRAVPAGTTPADLSPFSGPALAVSEVQGGNFSNIHASSNTNQIVGGPNAGTLYDYYVFGTQFAGAMDYDSLSSCGPCDSYATDPSTFDTSRTLFFSNAALFRTNLNSRRSEARVDGNNAYSPRAASDLYGRSAAMTFDGSQDVAHFPALTFSYAIDPATGNLVISEQEDLVRCATPPGTADPPPSGVGHANATNCPDFAPTGVHFKRIMVQNQAGRLVTVSDSFFSTDGAAHLLDLLYYQSVDTAGHPAFQFSWLSSAFQQFARDDLVAAAPAGAPSQIFALGSATAADGSETWARGAITLSAPPQGGAFLDSGTFELAYRQLLPAGGSWSVTQSFVTAFTQADVQSLAALSAASMMPRVAITSPASGATVAATPANVAGTVIAGGNGLPASVSVNGVSVPLGASGAFTASVPLAVGANTITVTTTDAGGLSASAQIAITYSPPPARSTIQITKVSYDGKNLLVTLACQAGGASCQGSVNATAKQKITTGRGRHRHSHTKQITVASGNYTLAAGQSETVKLKVGSTAQRLVARLKQLAATVTATTKEPNNTITAATSQFTLRKKKH